VTSPSKSCPRRSRRILSLSLDSGAIPVDEAVAIAKQIAEGLEAGYEKCIVHRDLKPANLSLTRDGAAKILDFGLGGPAGERHSRNRSIIDLLSHLRYYWSEFRPVSLGGQVKTLPLSDAKARLSELVEEVTSRDEVITITRNGRPVAVLLSPDEFESWKETVAVRSSSFEEIRRGLRALKRGAKLYSLEELFGD
jgi:prevent-host-death family protein